jgi:hypothetical protein
MSLRDGEKGRADCAIRTSSCDGAANFERLNGVC